MTFGSQNALQQLQEFDSEVALQRGMVCRYDFDRLTRATVQSAIVRLSEYFSTYQSEVLRTVDGESFTIREIAGSYGSYALINDKKNESNLALIKVSPELSSLERTRISELRSAQEYLSAAGVAALGGKDDVNGWGDKRNPTISAVEKALNSLGKNAVASFGINYATYVNLDNVIISSTLDISDMLSIARLDLVMDDIRSEYDMKMTSIMSSFLSHSTKYFQDIVPAAVSAENIILHEDVHGTHAIDHIDDGIIHPIDHNSVALICDNPQSAHQAVILFENIYDSDSDKAVSIYVAAKPTVISYENDLFQRHVNDKVCSINQSVGSIIRSLKNGSKSDVSDHLVAIFKNNSRISMVCHDQYSILRNIEKSMIGYVQNRISALTVISEEVSTPVMR